MSLWTLSHRASAGTRQIADRHYNRQKIGADQFVPPGRCLVLRRPGAFWVTSYPFARFTKHAWAGAMICSAFRRESGPLASELIVSALAATAWKAITDPAWHEFPKSHDGYSLITFVDPEKTKRKRDPGRCFRRAGFVEIGESKGGLVALGFKVPFPSFEAPNGATLELL